MINAFLGSFRRVNIAVPVANGEGLILLENQRFMHGRSGRGLYIVSGLCGNRLLIG
jgi:hypothetical protein